MSEYRLSLLSVIVVCITVIFVFLLLALWQYRIWLIVSLFVLLFTWAIVAISGQLNEQMIRHKRIRHLEETPLDQYGEVQYLPEQTQENYRR